MGLIVAYTVLAVGLFGLLTSTVFLVMVLVGVAAFRREARRQDAELLSEPAFLPKVTLFKPLHGAEAGLEGNLRSFFEQDYLERGASGQEGLGQEGPGQEALRQDGPGQDASGQEALGQEFSELGFFGQGGGRARVEILFCARTHADEGMKIARRIAAEYPRVATRFVASGEPWAPNAKACSMAVMAKVATHDLWVISDSDVRVDREYLRRVVLPFRDARAGCATCLYRGVAVDGIWAELEAIGMSVEMSSGVLVANLVEPMQFALGPTMVMRRACVEEMGGFEATAFSSADDFVLGNRIAANGHRVLLSGHAIDHIVLNVGFADSIRHQMRWMKSTRFSRPKGHLGTGLTFGVPFGVVALAGSLMLGMPVLGWCCLGLSLLGRMVQGFVVGKLVVRERRPWRAAVLFPVRDLMGMFFWVASYGSNRIVWRGEVYELGAGGTMRPAGASRKAEPPMSEV